MVAYFNPKTCPHCQKNTLAALSGLHKEELFQKENIQTLYMDYLKQDFFGSHYDLTEKQYLFFFVRNQIQKFEVFDELMGQASLYSKVLEFVQQVVSDVVIPIRSLEEVEQILEDKKIVGIYLGQQGKSWRKYYDLAIRNFSFDFYSSFD